MTQKKNSETGDREVICMSQHPGAHVARRCNQRGALNSFALALCIMILFLAGNSRGASAQTACIPAATGVPGLSGPPDWTGNWNMPSNTSLDDPRWSGALAFTWGTGTSGEQAKFQAVQANQHLYLSWYAELPPNMSPQANIVYIGFGQHSGTASSPQNFGIFINLNTLTTSVANTSNGTPNIKSVDAAGSFSSASGAVPGWVTQNTAVWINSPANTFAVQMAVPINNLGNDTGLDLGTDFNMWFEMQEALPPSTPTPTVWDAIYPDGRAGGPPAATDVIGNFNVAVQGPAPSTWAPFHLQSGSGDPACTLQGVSIDTLHIGTTNPVSSQILFSASGAPGGSNTFFAEPYNGTGSPIPANGINATFRIANWGSIATPAPWTTIPSVVNPASNSTPIPSGQYASPSSINSTWQVADPWLTDFRNGTKPLHQCMLVELSGPGLIFSSNGVVRNMDFQPVSGFERDAEISVVGLTPLSPTPRDVYLYVVARNMPSDVQSGWTDTYNKFFGTPDQRNYQRTMDIISRMSSQQVAEILPSYIVNAFNDSGKKITIDNKDYLIVHSQTPFGFYLLPHADVTHWITSLKGATQIAPNLYRIGVPNNGVAQVKTSITAIEPNGGGTQPTVGKLAAYVDLGGNFPQGTFSSSFGNGFSLNTGLEYMATSHFSAEGIFGYHYLSAKASGSENVYQFSADAKAYLLTGNLRPFINFGIGGYAFSPGSTYFGGNVGGGVLYAWSSRWGVQGSYNFHAVSTPANSTQFSTLQGGVRYVF